MNEHAIFYYPYASFTKQQSLLIKAAALYFDKLYILDPRKASWASFGLSEMKEDLQLLEQEKILERIAPENVLHQHEQTIIEAINRDRNDKEFLKLCEEKGDSRWTLALAKVPKALRDDPKYRPIDDSMRRAMSDYTEVYDEMWGDVEYRYADYPFAVGEAIMLNHALVGSLLHTQAIPITDDPIHSKILDYKLSQARKIPEFNAALKERIGTEAFAKARLATAALTDLDLGVIPEDMPLEKIFEYRHKNKDELKAARNELSWMARKIKDEPWTEDFKKEVNHDIIPDMHEKLKPVKKSWLSWVKVAGFSIAGATVVLGLFGSPLTPVGLAIAGLTISKDVGLKGLELFHDWKQGKSQNGLHYLMKLKKRK